MKYKIYDSKSKRCLRKNRNGLDSRGYLVWPSLNTFDPERNKFSLTNARFLLKYSNFIDYKQYPNCGKFKIIPIK